MYPCIFEVELFRRDGILCAQLRVELDAYYARLYGLTRDEMRYILDPKKTPARIPVAKP